MFQRESGKALKDKKMYYDKAKKALQAGNEEGCRLYLESAQQKDSESMKYLKISNRLEALAGKVGANYKSQDVSLETYCLSLKSSDDEPPKFYHTIPDAECPGPAT